MQINGLIWQWGGDIWDETQTKPALGTVNSDIAVKAFQRYLDLLKYAPPVAKTGQMDIFVIQDLYMQGKVAAIVDWVGLAKPVIDPKLSKVADKSGFAIEPGRRLADGSISRWANIGGQPFVLTTWNSDEVVHESLEIVKWWLSKPVQIELREARRTERHAERDGHPEYATWAPYNQRLSRQLQVAEGRLAYPRILPAADRAAGAVRQGDHRPDLRQAGARYGGGFPGQAAARGRPDQVTTAKGERRLRSLPAFAEA